MASEPLVESFFSLSSKSESPPPSDPRNEDQVKARLSSYTPRSPDDKTTRILQSFLDHLPHDGRQYIAAFIADCDDENLLFRFSEHLFSAILLPLRARGPTPSATPSPVPEAEARVDEVASTVVQASSLNSQSKLKGECLQRDGHRCIVTGAFDNEHAPENTPDGAPRADTELVHILPFSLGKYSKGTEDVKVARIWAALYTCFPAIREYTGLSPDNINDFTNLMTLVVPLHAAFGKMQFALEPTNEENTYRLQLYPRFPTFYLVHLPALNANNERIVTFEKHANYPLPDPVLLSTHAAIARIVHASGMTETIEKILHDRDAIACLAPDGSTELGHVLLLAC